MNFPVIEMFYSIQGEGKYMGVPSFFVRVAGCNLRCVFKDSICDTPYSSFNPEKSPYKSMDDIVDNFMKMRLEHPNVNHLVITGGEPMLYQEGMFEFIRRICYCSYHEDSITNNTLQITIETNGTRDPSPFMKDYNCLGYDTYILFSISPKLSSSVDKEGKHISLNESQRHDKERIKIDILKKYIQDYRADIQLKFVYSGEECIYEIKNIMDQLNDNLINNDKCVYLMPEGTTVEQMNTKGKECVEQCLKYGWKFAPRLHILIWGDKRGV